MADIRCPYAPCGLVSLLCLFAREGVLFCATKLILKYGAVTRHEPPNCTKILGNLRKLNFFTNVHHCQQVNRNIKIELKEAEKKLKDLGREAGLLLYSTPAYSHCVTVYLTKQGEMKVQDAHLDIDHIEGLDQISEFQVFALKYVNGKPLIVTNWGEECHIDVCENEWKKLKDDESQETTPAMK